MSFENFNKQEKKSEEIINPEVIVGVAESGPDVSSQFEGSQIFLFNKDGVPVRYAIRRNDAGELEGNSFLVQATGFSGNGEGWSNSKNGMSNLEDSNPNRVDHRIAWTQSMSESELNAVEKILADANINI